MSAKKKSQRQSEHHALTSPNRIGAFVDGEKNVINVIVETPKNNRNKFRFDEERGVYELAGVLARGLSFPFDFGFIPSTKADDGDPLDVILLMDEPAFPGCLVKSRVIGVMEATQTEDGETTRNDRLFAVPVQSHDHARIKSVSDIDKKIISQLEHFFRSYNEEKGKKFKVLGIKGPSEAMKIVERFLV
ncbi:MAG: Inorganic pyrophosphatase [Acidobacteriales bacterium]|nr:Inorganic pyrophosphatase [Terriglobales bacterium]